jgi:hypothetical protein
MVRNVAFELEKANQLEQNRDYMETSDPRLKVVLRDRPAGDAGVAASRNPAAPVKTSGQGLAG